MARPTVWHALVALHKSLGQPRDGYHSVMSKTSEATQSQEGGVGPVTELGAGLWCNRLQPAYRGL